MMIIIIFTILSFFSFYFYKTKFKTNRDFNDIIRDWKTNDIIKIEYYLLTPPVYYHKYSRFMEIKFLYLKNNLLYLHENEISEKYDKLPLIIDLIDMKNICFCDSFIYNSRLELIEIVNYKNISLIERNANEKMNELMENENDYSNILNNY